jgi:hypothetical protein
MRDEFSPKTKDLLAKRAGFRCSNPNCRQATVGPQADPQGATNLGVAAHIIAASPDGPRHDGSLTTEQRTDIDNGIWLCQTCAKLVDNDETRYTVESLKASLFSRCAAAPNSVANEVHKLRERAQQLEGAGVP